MSDHDLLTPFSGPNTGVYIIAELSANHNQDFNIALESINAMKEAGADAVKLQTFTAEAMTLDSDKPWFRAREDSLWAGQKLFDLYARGMTPWEWHPKLKKRANELGMDFFSTPFDIEAVERLESIDVPAYKIASLEITDIQLIERVAATGKPIIMSTGIAEEKDIRLAVDTCRKQNNENIALLKCTSAYPAPYEETNLSLIPLLKEKFNAIPGLSDHSLGIAVPVAAVALGAKIIEKHFILDKSIPAIDRDFSLSPEEFRQMADAVRIAEKAIGKADFVLKGKQLNARKSARSLFAVVDISKGDYFNADNIKSLRPGLGLHPKYLKDIFGKKALIDIERATPLRKI